MKSTTSTYKQIIASGNTRKFHVTVNLTLADNTQITITEADIMDNSFKLLSASSGTDSFDIGSAIIGKCQFTLMNFDDSWTAYDFFNATAVVWVGMDGDVDENDNQVYYRMGFYTVDEPAFAGSLVSLEMLDNMWKFDVPLDDVNITYDNNTSCREIVSAICSHCGVTLAAPNFHGYNFKITKKPEEDMNCREMLQYIAMIGCNFCIINSSGALDIRWYDTSANPSDELDGGTFSTNTTPYSDGDNADGGNFTNYSSGADYDGGSFIDPNVVYFTRLMSRNIGTDRLEITGVKFVIEDTDYRIGQEGYVLSLENPLVDTSNVNRVLNLIWDVIEDFKIRTFNVTALPDLSPEVGDCVAVSYKGNMVYSYLTNYTFTPSLATASLGAITPTRSLTKRYSKAVKAAVEIARKNTNEIISDYDLAVQRMNNLAINAMGAYQDYEDLSTGGRVYYLSNMPITKDSSGHCSFVAGATVFKMTGDGFFVSTDGGQTWTNGYDAHTGALVVNVLYAIGIHAEWIKTGQLTVGGSTSGTANPYIVVKDASNNTICTINSDGIIMGKGYIASSDYADTTPISPYSQSGMKIDVNNKYVKSPYFGFDETGAHLKGEIEATSGKIGAASIDSNSIKVIGNIALYSGSDSFEFSPYDYRLVEDFKLSLKRTGNTTVAVTVVEHKSTDTTIGTYTLSTNDEVLTATLNHTLGSPTNQGTYRLTITGGSCEIAVKDGVLAYMGVGGFKGVLEGIFKGYIESDKGEIAGYKYSEGKFTDGIDTVDFDNQAMYSSAYAQGFDPHHDRTYFVAARNGVNNYKVIYAIQNGFNPETDDTDDLTYPRMEVVLDKTNQSSPIAQISKYLSSEDYDSVIWEKDLPSKLSTAVYTLTDVDPGVGVPLEEGHFIIVYES